MRFPKKYNPKKVEDRVYRFWQSSGFFNPDRLPGKRKKTYTIVIPPPNITGSLHMGHALNVTCQDILIRWKRLQGYKTLWLPGTDHAGIATQNVVEKQLQAKGKTRFDLGRQKLIRRIWQWKEKYGSLILNQLKKLGASCDWSRTRFTMDKNYAKAVKIAFLQYYKKGLIYQGKRVINWCLRCQTSLSDLELEYKEEKGKLYYIKYPLLKSTGFVVVATTRPETMLGDTAIAVNPKDKRYKKMVGEKAILPLVGRELPIIKDDLVDPKFGTGAVKITPAHDFTDYKISLRHKLSMVEIIDKEGKISKKAPSRYRGLKILEARKKVIDDLKKEKRIKKTESFIHRVPYCYRCKTRIEFIPSKQWFLKMDKLAKLAEAPVRKGKIRFYPKRFEKIYLDWLKKVRDWCISRQIWWGHKIPLPKQSDVLDTWFSSALWPFATLGWPRKTKDLKVFYPTETLSTARDIMNLWVARMIFSGMEFMRKIPFKRVYIHPVVLTKKGERMSKSLGTGVDPIELIGQYGADATRFGIIWQVMGGQDIKFVKDNIIMGRKFCNKIWNASRFVFMQSYLRGTKIQRLTIKSKNLTRDDKKILATLDKTINQINRNLEKFQFGKAARALYKFFWHDFCDQYIEKAKVQIKEAKRKEDKGETIRVLLYVLLNSLKILHPFLPFITEEIYQKLPIKNKEKCLMVEKWPK
jgi:valyl-tRNA synthetase